MTMKTRPRQIYLPQLHDRPTPPFLYFLRLPLMVVGKTLPSLPSLLEKEACQLHAVNVSELSYLICCPQLIHNIKGLHTSLCLYNLQIETSLQKKYCSHTLTSSLLCVLLQMATRP